jgi:5-formyltetrahydrofolate cyclo-ligase
MPMNERKRLRKHYLALRTSLDSSTCLAHGQAIVNQISRQPFYAQANQLAFYQAMKGEVDLTPLLTHALSLGKKCYLPCITKEDSTLHFRLYDSTQPLEKNHYGIYEPLAHHSSCNPEDLDVIFVPLVAFDSQGNRLGMGAGYYDRTFAFLLHNPTPKPWFIGIAHALQHAPHIASEEWDVPLHAIVTETGHTLVHPLPNNWKE